MGGAFSAICGRVAGYSGLTIEHREEGKRNLNGKRSMVKLAQTPAVGPGGEKARSVG